MVTDSSRLPATSYTFLGACVLPVAAAIWLNGNYLYWLVSAVCVAVAVVALCARGGWFRPLALLIQTTSVLAGLALGASLYVQGVGFNEQFFFHLNGETMRVARQAYSLPFFGCALLGLLLCLWPLWLSTPFPAPRWLLSLQSRPAVLLLIGLVTHAPLLSLLSYAKEHVTQQQQPMIIVSPPQRSIQVQDIADKRNLVIIYAESLEASFSNPLIFDQDHAPNLSRLARSAVAFSDVRQVSDTGWTMGGLVAAQCAIPISAQQGVNDVLANIPVPLPDEICLGDVLSAYGYHNVFMGGASLDFAGKGNFLSAHGYHETLGREQLRPQLENPDYQTGWGLYDDSLLALARQKLAHLHASQQPFSLSILTLDTHPPAAHPSHSCETTQPGSTTLSAVQCTDQLLSQFVEHIRHHYPQTVVAVFSDHFMQRSDVSDQLDAQQAQRRLRFFIQGNHLSPQQIDTPGSHFDVMPTLLETLGITAYQQHNLGASLLSSASLSGPGRWFELQHKGAVTLARQATTIDLQLSDQVLFSRRGPSVEINGQKFIATESGMKLHKAIFAMEFDARQKLVKFHTNSSFELFRSSAPEGFIVGISSNPQFNREVAGVTDAPVIYFAGHLNHADFVAAPLWWEAAVAIPSLP